MDKKEGICGRVDSLGFRELYNDFVSSMICPYVILSFIEIGLHYSFGYFIMLVATVKDFRFTIPE